jgi:hypothetical protein
VGYFYCNHCVCNLKGQPVKKIPFNFSGIFSSILTYFLQNSCESQMNINSNEPSPICCAKFRKALHLKNATHPLFSNVRWCSVIYCISRKARGAKDMMCQQKAALFSVCEVQIYVAECRWRNILCQVSPPGTKTRPNNGIPKY